MKYLLTTILSVAVLQANAQTDKVVTQGENLTAEYSITTNPKLVIKYSKVTFTDGKTEASFSPDERVVLFVKKNDTTTGVQGDVNGDSNVTISDVSKLVDILLEKKD